MLDTDKLREIKTFPSLVKYLRDELDWPIEADNFEEITFDYDPKELGIDPKTAANIQEIKQLRPLVTNQPWGIFFIKFEPKRLPIVALRRILSQLVIKKRASARKSEQASWNLNDLLFISNYGEGDQRQITFAHFAQDKITGDLPTLKVLGWDDADTALHIDHVHHELKEKLCWPENKDDLDGWRAKWSSAFMLRHKEVITTSKDLAIHLADLAKRVRNRANQVLSIETEHGPLRKLHKAFQQALIHDLEKDDFADMYAQTIAYGLLAARASRPTEITSKDLPNMVSITNPFLKEMLGTFLTVGGRKGKMDFDELGIREIVDLLNSPDTHMEDILRDFGDRTRQEDPVIHFYELFLAEYDKKKKVERGVFYTPQPVVSYIVRSVHELLQKEFGLEDGLADTTTWGEMVKKNPSIKIPDGLSPNEPFVNILDPATGTATFLVETIDVIHKTMMVRWQKKGLNEKQSRAEWNDYVPKHLLPRLHGFELMMAPYAIAHMKIGLKLYETVYRFKSEERVRVYLTNSLEPAQDFSDTFALMAPALAHEAEAVNKVKKEVPFTVIFGNPPYSGHSVNDSDWINELLRKKLNDAAGSYFQVNGADLGERNPKWLNDDYVKFIRYCQHLLSESRTGILAFVTNHSYIANPTFRGMRQSLLVTFSKISLLDLHGNSTIKERNPDGSIDQNVFEIKQGVAIGIFVKSYREEASGRTVLHADLWGSKENKYKWLSENSFASTRFIALSPCLPFFMFVPQDENLRLEYEQWTTITQVMPTYVLGFQTHRDHFAIDIDEARLRDRICDFRSTKYSDNDIRCKYNLVNNNDWDVSSAREQLRSDKKWERYFTFCLYRPFDWRACYFSTVAMDRPRRELLDHVLGKDNLILNISRIVKLHSWQHVLVSTVQPTAISLDINGSYAFPLYLYLSDERKEFFGADINYTRNYNRMPNLDPQYVHILTKEIKPDLEPGSTLNGNKNFLPSDILSYVYAILHSPVYRKRYHEFLKIDFPRLPPPGSLELFNNLASLGSELVALHLMESPKLEKHLTKFVGKGDNEVIKVRYKDETVWINSSQGFQGVLENVWNFHIGGYQVCEKWLKDRKGRTLSNDDISHYQKIVVAIIETIRLMTEIDKVIEKYGGWPGAFTTVKNVQPGKAETTAPLHPQEDFIISLIKRLGKGKNKGIHSVFSGFNGLFKEKFPGEKPQAWTKKMAEEGRIVTTPIVGKGKEYQMIYLPEDAPKN